MDENERLSCPPPSTFGYEKDCSHGIPPSWQDSVCVLLPPCFVNLEFGERKGERGEGRVEDISVAERRRGVDGDHEAFVGFAVKDVDIAGEIVRDWELVELHPRGCQCLKRGWGVGGVTLRSSWEEGEAREKRRRTSAAIWMCIVVDGLSEVWPVVADTLLYHGRG